MLVLVQAIAPPHLVVQMNGVGVGRNVAAAPPADMLHDLGKGDRREDPRGQHVVRQTEVVDGP